MPRKNKSKPILKNLNLKESFLGRFELYSAIGADGEEKTIIIIEKSSKTVLKGLEKKG